MPAGLDCLGALPGVEDGCGALARFCDGGAVLTDLGPSLGILCRLGPAVDDDVTDDRFGTGGLDVGFLVMLGAGAVMDDVFRAVAGLAPCGGGGGALCLGPGCFLTGTGEVLDCCCGGLDPSDEGLGDLVDLGISPGAEGRLA